MNDADGAWVKMRAWLHGRTILVSAPGYRAPTASRRQRMRGTVAAGLIAGAAMVGGFWTWQSPTVTLLRLKLALDRHDLVGVEKAVDFDALTGSALSGLLEDRGGEPETVRLTLRGEGGWLPAIASARDYLKVLLQRTVERMVEEPGSRLQVSWADFRRALATLRREGAVASLLYREGNDGPEYSVRLRNISGRWRIVSVERDGMQAILRSKPARDKKGRKTALGKGAADVPPGDERFAMAVDELEPAAHTVRSARHREQQPFARRLEDGSWTVQVASSTDALEAQAEREWFSKQKETAFLLPGTVRGTTWQRVMIGRYPTSADAERAVERLAAVSAEGR